MYCVVFGMLNYEVFDGGHLDSTSEVQRVRVYPAVPFGLLIFVDQDITFVSFIEIKKSLVFTQSESILILIQVGNPNMQPSRTFQPHKVTFILDICQSLPGFV